MFIQKGLEMNSAWMLAEVSPNTPPTIKSEPAEQQNTAITAADGNTAVPVTKQPEKSNPMFTFIMFAVLFVLMYFMLFRGPKKQRAQQAKLISSLKKNDRVRTIGGIFGTVIDVRDDEVTLKIDESNNTKIRVAPEAISRVLTDDKKQE